MDTTININLKKLSNSPQILIGTHKQACTSKTHQGCIVGFQHVGQHLLHYRGVHGKEKNKAAGGEARVEGGGLRVTMSLAMVHGAVWGVP